MASRPVQALAAAVLAAGLAGGAQAMSEPPRSPSAAAPARPGDVAIQEELDAARAAGTVAAYELFVARHPGHPLEATAKAELERLRATGAR